MKRCKKSRVEGVSSKASHDIGWIGLGRMGAAIAQRLTERGFTVTAGSQLNDHPSYVGLQSDRLALAFRTQHA